MNFGFSPSHTRVNYIRHPLNGVLKRSIVVAAALFSSAALADQCTPISGQFFVTGGAPCGTSPLCLQGAFVPNEGTAQIGGTSNSMVTGVFPSPVPNSSVFTAQSTLTDGAGNTITTIDAGIGTGCTGPLGPCDNSSEVLKIMGGTGIYENATGVIFLSGPYMAVAPGPGSYSGQICTAKKTGKGGK